MTTLTSSTNAAGAATSVTATVAVDRSIRPFRVQVPESELQDLRQRIVATRWPEAETVRDSSQGAELATVRKLAQYWATEYDWRECEQRLNAWPQFMTTIDGLDIHFIHVRSKHVNALPVLLTHGWPGSVIWLLKLVGPLTDPTAYGVSAADAFDVVIPSMPGYGWSGKPTAPGWDPVRIARAWTALMRRLGYERFTAHGSDWGAIVTEQMGAQAPPELIGIHTSMPSAVPAEIAQALPGRRPPPGLSADEGRAFERLDHLFTHGLTYALQQASRPQTLYGIADSPIGLAAWFIDPLNHEFFVRIFDEQREGLTRDDVLDNITVTWLTNTAISAARLYWENKLAFFAPMGVEIPVAVSVFPDEIYQAPRSWAERAYPNLIHFNELDKGGHFAAWEQPALLVAELRTGLRSLR